MAFNTTDNKRLYSGNGATTTFSAPFLFYDNADLTVTLVNKTTGVETPQTITTHYTVSGAGSISGGTVTFLTAPPSTVNVLIKRVVFMDQLVDLKEGDKFPPDTVERSLDELTMMAQQLAEVDARCVKLPQGSALSNVELPDIFLSQNHGKALKINSSGTGFDVFTVSPTDFANPLTTEGDLVVHDGNAASRLPVGGDGSVLEADSAAGGGVAWKLTPTKLANASDATRGDALVGYKRTDSGAVAGTVHTRLHSLPIDAVADYGADNTGATTTTTALQAAIDAAEASGRPLYIPKGTYDLGGTGLVNDAPAFIYGEGRATVLRKSTDTNVQALKVTASGSLVRDIHFSYTAGTTGASINHAALEGNGASWLRFEGVTVDGKFYIGIHLNDCAESQVFECTVKGVVNRAFYVSADVQTNDIELVNCIANGATTGTTPFTNYAFNTNFFGTGTGLRVSFTNCIARNFTDNGFMPSENGYNQVFTNCHAVNCTGSGFLAQLANSVRGRHTAFVGCTAQSCGYGFYVVSCDYVNITGCRAFGNSKGIYAIDSFDVALSGNVCENNTGEQILVNATSAASGGRTALLSNVTRGGTYGIYTGANADRCLTVGNLCLNSSTLNISVNATNSVTANNLNV